MERLGLARMCKLPRARGLGAGRAEKIHGDGAGGSMNSMRWGGRLEARY